MKFTDIRFGDFITLRNGRIGIVSYISTNEIKVYFKDNRYVTLIDLKDDLFSDLDIIKIQRIDKTFIGECLNLEDEETKIRAIETLYEIKGDKNEI